MSEAKHWSRSESTDHLTLSIKNTASSSFSTDQTQSTTQAPRDVPADVIEALHARGLEVNDVGNVDWHLTSPHHPRRWSLSRKIYDTSIIIFLEFFMTLASNEGTAIAQTQADAIGTSAETAIAAFITVYFMGQALGSIIFPPIAESYGSRSIYATCGFGFMTCGLILGNVPTLPTIFVCRFFEGLFSAMPAVVAASSLENMWDMRARIWIFQLWTSFSVVGLSCGPFIATVISLNLGWHWVFLISAMVGGSVGVLSLFMQESRPALQLEIQVNKVARATDYKGLTLDVGGTPPTFSAFVQTSLKLPVRLFFTEPLVFTIALMAASVYSFAYLFTEALPVVYQDEFGFGPVESSLVYLSLGVGAVLTVLPRPYDIYVLAKRDKEGVDVTPEDKLMGFYIAAPVLAIGLWWFAWTVPPIVHVTPWASIAALVLFGYSTVEFDNVLSGYLADTYASFAGSANAPLAVLRALFSGLFPLCGTQLFSLGPNYVLTALACLATAYCGIAVWFRMNGKNIRLRSPFAEKTWADATRTNSTAGLMARPVSTETA